jgi:hypothetical protein
MCTTTCWVRRFLRRRFWRHGDVVWFARFGLLGRPLVSLTVHRRAGLRDHTLAPGFLARKVEGSAAKALDDEAELILACEHLQHALDLSAAASSSRRVRPHVHGVGSRIKGRFWASGSSSDSESEDNVLSDHRASSQGLVSTRTLDRPLVRRR